MSGAGIETTLLHVRTRRGAAIKLTRSQWNPRLGKEMFFPCEFTSVAGPSVPVEGQITDVRSGRPLAGVQVNAVRIASSQFFDSLAAPAHLGDNRCPRTLSPRRVATGLRTTGRRSSSRLAVFDGGRPCEDPMQRSPLILDIKLAAGVMARGRVTDSRTGRPAEGSLEYFAFGTNPHLQEAPGFEDSGFLRGRAILHYRCDADGRFEIPVLPGPGILAFRADSLAQLPTGIGAASIDCARMVGGEFSTAPYLCGPGWFHLLTPLNPQPGTDSLALDLKVHSPATVTGTVRGPDGKLLSHYSLSDKSSFLEEARRWGRQKGAISEINGETFKLNVYSPGDHQRLVFYQHSRNLGGFLEFTGELGGPLDITLQPCATLQGRLVDDGGEPLGDVSLVVTASGAVADGNHAADSREAAAGSQLDQSQITTDKDGRFELRRVIPGLEYSAIAHGAITSRAGRRVPGGPVFTHILAQAGETKELGNVRVARRVPTAQATPPSAMEKNAAAGNPAADKPRELHGIVVSESGAPVSGALSLSALFRFQKRYRPPLMAISPWTPRNHSLGDCCWPPMRAEVGKQSTTRTWIGLSWQRFPQFGSC